MNGDQKSGPTASTDYLVPQATINNLAIGTLGDYLGLPTGVAQNVKVSELPLRAISLIWNEWFRDENLQNSYNIDKTTEREYDGDQAITGELVDNPLLYSSQCPPIAKPHGYFTSALPWPQKGPGVEISLGGSVPVTGIVFPESLVNFQVTQQAFSSGIGSLVWTTGKGNPPPAVTDIKWDQNGSSLSARAFIPSKDLSSGASVDLSESTPISINDLRQAFQIQKLMSVMLVVVHVTRKFFAVTLVL